MQDIFHWVPAFPHSRSCRGCTGVPLRACLLVGATCSLTALWAHTSSWPRDLVTQWQVSCLQASGGLLGLGGPAPALWTDTSGRVQSTDVFAGYCLFVLAFRGWFGFIFDQRSIGRSLKPRESEGRWGDAGSSPSLILLLSLLPVCVYAHYLHKCMAVCKLYIVFPSKLGYPGRGVFRKTIWVTKSSNMLS